MNKFKVLENLNHMLYSDDSEIRQLAVSLIKEDFEWVYLEAIDDKHYLPLFTIKHFGFTFEENLLYRLKLIIADFFAQPLLYKWYKLLKNILNQKILNLIKKK